MDVWLDKNSTFKVGHGSKKKVIGFGEKITEDEVGKKRFKKFKQDKLIGELPKSIDPRSNLDDKVKAQMADVRDENTTLVEEKKQLEEVNKQLGDDVDRLEGELAKYDELDIDLETYGTAKEDAEKEKADLIKKIEDIEGEVKTQKDAITKLESDLSIAQKKADKKTEENKS